MVNDRRQKFNKRTGKIFFLSLALCMVCASLFGVQAHAADAWSQYGRLTIVDSSEAGGFNQPTGVAVDGSGNVYVADYGNNRIQKLDVSTNVWSEWGKAGGQAGSGLGEFNAPTGIAVDGDGNVYVADMGNHRIQKLTLSTNAWSEWGKAGGIAGGDLGEFNSPVGVAVDGEGNVYVADYVNNRVQKLTLSTNAWSEWGKGGGLSGRGLGEFNLPSGVAVDGSGNVYVADSGNQRIQRLTLSTNAWNDWGRSDGFQGNGLGEFFSPMGLTVDRGGNVYVADSGNNRIQKLNPSADEWTEIGGVGLGLGEFFWPFSVAIDGSGNLYVVDSLNHRVQKLAAATDTWSQWCATSTESGSLSGEFNMPFGVTVDGNGDVYVADGGNNRIQKLAVSTNTWSEWGKAGGETGNGLGEFNAPFGVAVDGDGNVYAAEYGNHRVQKLTLSTNTWSEWGAADGGRGNGLGEFYMPTSVAVDGSGNVYVADFGNHRIQKLTVSTNTWSEWGTANGGPGDGLGEFNSPSGVAVDGSGNVYVADSGNHRIQKLTVSTNAWSEWGKIGGGPERGLGEFFNPVGVAVDGIGNVYVADSGNNRIQKLTVSTDTWSEWGKSGGRSGRGLGEFNLPGGVAVDGSGDIYVTDFSNHRVQLLRMPASPIADFAISAKTSTTASFNWTAASGATAIVIEQSPAGAGAWTTATSGAIAPLATSATVTGLSASTAYDFRLVVTGGANAGISNIASVTTDGVVSGAPALHPPIAGDAQVELAWSPVSGATGYKVFQSATSGTYGTEIAAVSDSVHHYTVTGLTNGTTYYFAVRATDSLGNGEVSLQLSATPATVPAAPENVTAVAGNGQATVDFDVPANNGGSPITGYEVTASPGNIVVTGTNGPIVVTGLTSGTSYTFTVKAMNRVGRGDASAPSNAVVPRSPTVGGSVPTAADPSEGAVLVNGKAVNAGTATTSKRNGQIVKTVILDPKKLADILATADPHAVVTISINSGFDAVEVELNGDTVQRMEEKQAVLEIKKDSATYTVPTRQIDMDSIRERMGKSTALQDIRVQVEVAAPSADRVKAVENAAAKGAFELVAPPVEFTIRAMHGDNAIQVSKFSAYVKRTIAIPDGVDPKRISTGVVVDPDGTVRHVPTKVVARDGKYYAVISSLTNSAYAVIWKPLEFRDTANHWAKNIVDDIGKRLIIEGTGDGKFSPDREITRAEFAAILVRGLGLEPENGATPFSDVAPTDWFGGALSTAKAYRLIDGSAETAVRPNDRITREEAMTMIAGAMKITGLKAALPAMTTESALRPYEDAADASAWAQSGIADCIQSGIVSGRSPTRLAPKAYMTRAEVAAVVQRLLRQSDLI